jgi:hypothetical protein
LSRRRPPSGRDLSRTAIWAGIVATGGTIPAQIDSWHVATFWRTL